MDDKRLEEMYQATMENNRMLKNMRRSAFVGGIVKVIWWVVLLIVLPYLTWLYIQPYLDPIMSQYETVQVQGEEYSADMQKLKDLYNQYFGPK